MSFTDNPLTAALLWLGIASIVGWVIGGDSSSNATPSPSTPGN